MDLPLATEKPSWDVSAPGWGQPQAVQQAWLAIALTTTTSKCFSLLPQYTCCEGAVMWLDGSLNGLLPPAGVPSARLRNWKAGRRPDNHAAGHAAYVWAAICKGQLPKCVLGSGGRGKACRQAPRGSSKPYVSARHRTGVLLTIGSVLLWPSENDCYRKVSLNVSPRFQID